MSQITLGPIAVDVVLKDIKHVHLTVHPPTGRVRISAPRRMRVETIRLFAISKLDWIKRQQATLRAQPRETPREHVARESHYVWGRRYLLAIAERNEPPSIELTPRRMLLTVRPGTTQAARKAVVDNWYREQLKQAVTPLLARWEPRLDVHARRCFVQAMTTKWGSCNHKARTIRLNTELAKKPPACLEYVVVHELVHLLEPTHNARFTAVMDRFMPQWQVQRQLLNRLPVRGGNWTY